MNKRNYIISNDGKYLYVTLMGNSKNTGKIYYTDYSPELEKIMNSRIFRTAVTNGYNKGNYIKFYYNDFKQTVYFHHIIYCFLYRNLTIENYKDVLNRFSQELSLRGLEVDHLHEDVFNNCKANLSLISVNSNRSKRTIRRKLKFFADLVEAYDGSNYRVQFCYISSFAKQRIRTLRFYSNRIEDVQNIRNYLAKIIITSGYNQWRIRNSGEGVLLQDNTYSVFGDIQLLGKLPKLIAEFDIADLQRYITEDLPLKDFTKWDNKTAVL